MPRFLLIILTSLMLSFPMAAAIHWESLDTPVNPSIEMIATEQAKVGSGDGCIYITTEQKVEVKVFTILGQMVITQTLAPGTYRLPITSRGIYIVKIGSATRRIII